jgi:hypothetical protein
MKHISIITATIERCVGRHCDICGGPMPVYEKTTVKLERQQAIYEPPTVIERDVCAPCFEKVLIEWIDGHKKGKP